jgi:hypothetical protein
MWEIVALVIMTLGVWLVFDGLRAREAAVRAARAACEQQGLQFLDYTVQGARTRFARDAQGHARLRRVFRFEFSEDGFGRRAGCVITLGARVESLQLEPYRVS